MRSRGLFWISLAIALTVSGCAVTTPYNPFKVPEAEIRSKVKVIALAPLNLPGDLEEPEPVQTKYESLIEAKLREAGFAVVPSREYAAIWKQMIERLGGYFDPLTGKRDEEKFKTVKEHTLRELGAKGKTDAVLYSGMGIVKANFAGNQAAWHGTSEFIVTGGFWGAFFAGNSQGTVPALSLFIAISDLNGVDMYANAGGIQVISKLSGRQFITVPRHELFTDEERNRQAVSIALAPLTGKTAPQGASPPSAKMPQ